MVYRDVQAPVLLHVLAVFSHIILCTSDMLVYTKEICNQELIYAVTKSFLNAS